MQAEPDQYKPGSHEHVDDPTVLVDPAGQAAQASRLFLPSIGKVFGENVLSGHSEQASTPFQYAPVLQTQSEGEVEPSGLIEWKGQA